jgi:hypothetical protein
MWAGRKRRILEWLDIFKTGTWDRKKGLGGEKRGTT